MSDTRSDASPIRRALRRRHRGREPRSRRRLVLLSAIGGCSSIVLAGAAWVLITGLLAHAQLEHVRKELPQLRRALGAGQVAQAQSISADVAKRAHRAHQLTTGPAWSVGARIPILGSPLRTSRTIATASDDIGNHVLPGLLDLADTLTSTALRHGSAIDLRPVTTAERTLTAASSSLTDDADNVRNASGSWVPFVSSGRKAASQTLDKLRDQVTDAVRAVHTLLPMLGQSKSQRYFVGLENEGQARGLGGLPGAFAIVTADHGKLTFTHFENDNTLKHLGVNLDFGADFAKMYRRPAPTQSYGNSNFSPHFPYAARIWAAMWEKKTGEHIDGALALDPTALSYLLKVTGPANLPDGKQVSSGNVVALTQKDQYRFFSDDKARKRYLIDIADAVSHQLLSGHGDTKRLLHAATRAASQRRIVLWSADPAVKANLVHAGYAGVVEGNGAPLAGFVVNNLTGSKLDYYLGRRMTYRRTSCGSASTALATVALTNGAPKTGLPRYVLRRDLPPGVRPTGNRLLVTYYGSAGATVRSVTADGSPLRAEIGRENGLVTATVDLEVPVGRTVTVMVSLTEPASGHSVQVLEQPLVQPIRVTVSAGTCN